MRGADRKNLKKNLRKAEHTHTGGKPCSEKKRKKKKIKDGSSLVGRSSYEKKKNEVNMNMPHAPIHLKNSNSDKRKKGGVFFSVDCSITLLEGALPCKQ